MAICYFGGYTARVLPVLSILSTFGLFFMEWTTKSTFSKKTIKCAKRFTAHILPWVSGSWLLISSQLCPFLLCCHITVPACSIHQEEQNSEICRVDRHAVMALWQVYTNTRWQHVTACWDLMYQPVVLWHFKVNWVSHICQNKALFVSDSSYSDW